MKLSIIVPMLNEARQLPRLLAQLRPFNKRGVEIVFADGGSGDGSTLMAERAGYSVLRAPRGRAIQMNAGAMFATGDVLLFLHADTQLPDDADRLVLQALAHGKYCWGRFDVRISGRPPMLRVVARLMNLRSHWSGIATGDQAIFVTRAAFGALGGFPDQALMEDIELSRRLRKISRPARIVQRVITSGRRWEAGGVWRTIWLMWRLRWAYWRGVPADHLAKAYR